MTDYRVYRLGVKEKLVISVVYMACTAVIAVLFFNNIVICVAGIPGLYVVFRQISERKCEQRKRRLNIEFKEMLLALSANMAAGYSMEKAFIPVYQEMEDLYQGRSYIQGELKVIISGLEMSTEVRILLNDLADRSGLEDVREFARVSAVAGRSGGNLVRMMKKMVQTIEERLEVEDEIDTMITSKRMEYNIMSAMPFAIVLYLRVCNPGYMNAVYGNVAGVVAMLVCLLLVIITVIWGRKITNIRV